MACKHTDVPAYSMCFCLAKGSDWVTTAEGGNHRIVSAEVVRHGNCLLLTRSLGQKGIGCRLLAAASHQRALIIFLQSGTCERQSEQHSRSWQHAGMDAAL